MHNIAEFKSLDEYQKFRGDVEFWYPHIKYVTTKNNLPLQAQDDIHPGENPTYPVFISGEIVIKFFGCLNHYNAAFENERIAHETLILDKTILAPQIKAEGRLFDDNTWFYLISTKISGCPLSQQQLSQTDKNNLAYTVGQQLQKIHSLPTSSALQYHGWRDLDLVAAANRSILPKHLIAQIPEFIKDVEIDSRYFVNGDLVPQHIFIDNNKLSGIIDWGDATVFDKHYELGKLMDALDWDKDLLRMMLDGANWQITLNFPKQALSMALYRQAMGLVQHASFDVFYKLPHIYQLEEIKTLNELADILFGVK